VSAYTQKDYEAIEAVVLESPRGRWFLNEFARRNRAADTLTLLKAIRKLERGVAKPSPQVVSDELAAELHALSETIGLTLDGLVTTEDVVETLTELSEDTPGNVLIGQVRSTMEQLSHVRRRIDGLLSARLGSTPTEGSGALTAENLSFFEGDEDLFEAVPQTGSETAGEARDLLSAAPSLLVVAEQHGGARFGARSGDKGAEHAGPGPGLRTSAPKAGPTDRIVFIRRTSSKETSIPLADEADSPAPSGRSQPGS
jgi:hypothetical protein